MHWSIFSGEKEESVEIGDLNCYTSYKSVVPKRDREQTSEYNTEIMLFQYRTKDMKVN